MDSELWKRPNFIRATVDIGVDEAKAAGLWNAIVLSSKKDASEDDLKSEKAAGAWKEMLSKSAEDADGARSWLEECPLGSKHTQKECLANAIAAVAKRLPIERTHLQVVQVCLESTAAMKSAETEKSLDVLLDSVKEQCTLMSQLAASTKTVTSELMQLLKKRKAVQQKAEEKKKTEAMKAEEQQGEMEKLRLQKKKKMNPFFLDFKTLVAEAQATVFTDPAKISDDNYARPFILAGSKLISVLTSASASDESLMPPTMGRWKTSFPAAKQFQSHGAVIAPVMKTKSEDPALLQLISKLLPDSINNEFPRFAAAVGTWFFYGESDMFICTDFESELVGGLRVQLGGETQFYGMPVTAIVDVCNATKMKAADIKGFLAEMTPDRLATIAERALPFVHGSLQPNSALVVPPGWVMSYATVGDGEASYVYGLRKGFLLRKGLEESKKQFQMLLAKEIGGTANTSWLQFLQTLADVELKGKPDSGEKRIAPDPTPPENEPASKKPRVLE
ncbi:unnamed protein product [Symbiodinium sp. CCMP2592]|nr:unnamed protein product [Symbiodinium sp. CCMP2592]